jgi:hypothetical protein
MKKVETKLKYFSTLKGGGSMAELIAYPPTEPKVRSSNPCADKKIDGNYLEHVKLDLTIDGYCIQSYICFK